MRKLALSLAAVAALPAIAIAAPGVNANLATPQEANNIDLGCLRGDLRATKYPSSAYDAANHERIMYNISRCTGGFIMGTNTDTWKSWHADVAANGSMTGKDLDGDRWKYDRASKLYTNLTTGRSCASANLRHVCAQ
jgi:hypothetical protein